jgi:hypothetical protein
MIASLNLKLDACRLSLVWHDEGQYLLESKPQLEVLNSTKGAPVWNSTFIYIHQQAK